MTDLTIAPKYKKLFDEIKQIDENGIESWSARDLMSRLEYDRWENFIKVINRAIIASRQSGIDSIGQFREVTKEVKGSNGATFIVKDFRLTRYACYLIAQNGISSKPAIAAAQSYFAIQTYRQEQIDGMSEDQKRLYVRSQVTKENVTLLKAAKDSGVYRFGTFNDAGYLGLYGLRAKEIKVKKGIGDDNILNRAGVTELAANLFRITQTQEVLQGELNKGKVIGDNKAASAHFMVGGKVRQTIKDIGGTLPENLPPEEDVRELEKRIVSNEDKQLAPAKKPLKMKNNISRIEISSKIFDTRAEVAKNRLIKLDLLNKNSELLISDVYTINKPFPSNDLQKISSMISNPVTQEFVIASEEQKAIPKTKMSSSGLTRGSSIELDSRLRGNDKGSDFSFAIEIGFLPGVTDNVSNTVREGIEDLLKTSFDEEEGVYSSQLFFLKGKLTEEEALKIAETLYNPLIQRMHLKSYETFIKDNGMDFIVPKVKLNKNFHVTEVNLDISDEELVNIGKSGIANPDGTRRGPLALNLEFMKTIQSYFKKLNRNPTDIELESIAQTWSEHCKHTIFADPIDEIKEGLFKTYIKGATQEIRKKKGKQDFCVSVFTDNSGAIAFDEDYLITHKVETHNSPSALDPFGGAITGIVGVNRDTIGFGMGAKPVANMYGFCFADPRVDIPLYRAKNKKNKMLSSRRIMEGVIAGVNSGGNQSGIPTPQGFVYFNESFRGKPLVFVGTVGLIPRKIKDKPSHLKKALPKDLIVMVGGRVGKDGIHGATFSSVAMDAGSPATSVQIGDPITQKKLSDAIIKEARNKLLYNSITDNGAGGLSCSIAEMAKESGGCIVDLEKVPLKYAGLNPWEIWVSESQERITLSIPKNNWNKFSDLMKRRGVEATVIGEFTDSGKCVVKMHGKTIMDMDMEFLHNGLPKRKMETKPPVIPTHSPLEGWMAKPDGVDNPPQNTILLSMLSRLNIASYEFISQQYDHIVQANAVLGPLQGKGRVNGDTSVIRPLLNSQKGVILSQALYPTYTEIDPYKMAAASIDTAIRNAIAVGANPDYISLLDNFCWCSSNEPERLWQLKQAAKACYDFAVAYGTPYISGKDSMFNDFKGFDEKGNPVSISALPTLLISSFGVIDDIKKVVSLDAKTPGDLIYLLGETFDEMGGSEYLEMLKDKDKKDYFISQIPNVNVEKNSKLYLALYSAIQKNLVSSSLSIRHGGLAIALAKKAMGGKLGLSVDLKNILKKVESNEVALHSESQGRILITVSKENKEAFEKTLEGNSFSLIGEVTKEPSIRIKGLHGEEIVNLGLEKLIEAYRERLYI